MNRSGACDLCGLRWRERVAGELCPVCTIRGRIAALESQLAASEAKCAEMKARKDGAYLERNRVVAALAKCFPSGIARTAIEGWSDDWHGCVYIDLPTGQASWHFHDSHAYLFGGLPPYVGKWDGHDTDEKYRRLSALTCHPDTARAEEAEREKRMAMRLMRAREDRLTAIRDTVSQNKDDDLVRVEVAYFLDCPQSEIDETSTDAGILDALRQAEEESEG